MADEEGARRRRLEAVERVVVVGLPEVELLEQRVGEEAAEEAARDVGLRAEARRQVARDAERRRRLRRRRADVAAQRGGRGPAGSGLRTTAAGAWSEASASEVKRGGGTRRGPPTRSRTRGRAAARRHHELAQHRRRRLLPLPRRGAQRGEADDVGVGGRLRRQRELEAGEDAADERREEGERPPLGGGEARRVRPRPRQRDRPRVGGPLEEVVARREEADVLALGGGADDGALRPLHRVHRPEDGGVVVVRAHRERHELHPVALDRELAELDVDLGVDRLVAHAPVPLDVALLGGERLGARARGRASPTSVSGTKRPLLPTRCQPRADALPSARRRTPAYETTRSIASITSSARRSWASSHARHLLRCAWKTWSTSVCGMSSATFACFRFFRLSPPPAAAAASVAASPGSAPWCVRRRVDVPRVEVGEVHLRDHQRRDGAVVERRRRHVLAQQREVRLQHARRRRVARAERLVAPALDHHEEAAPEQLAQPFWSTTSSAAAPSDGATPRAPPAPPLNWRPPSTRPTWPSTRTRRRRT